MWPNLSKCSTLRRFLLNTNSKTCIPVYFTSTTDSTKITNPTRIIFDHDPNSIKQARKPRNILEPDPKIEKLLMEKHQKSLSFDDIPGPSTLKAISRFWSVVPVVGTELTIRVLQNLLSGGRAIGGLINWNGSLLFFKRLFDKYGPVIRLHAAFGQDVVLISKPEHIETILRNENRKEARSSLDSLQKYILEHRSYKQVGPFLIQGSEWNKYRKAVNRPVATQILQLQPHIEKICDQFVAKVDEVRNVQDEISSDFKMELNKWVVDCFSCVTFGKSLGVLANPLLSPNSDAARLLDGLIGATEAIRKCEQNFHLWKFIESKPWKDLIRNCHVVDNVLIQHVQKTFQALREKKSKRVIPEETTLIESMMLKEGITEEDIMVNLLDSFLIGTNSISHTVAYLLFHLARNPRCQLKIFEEITNKSVTGNLKNLSYLQACIKECSRLDPPIPILSRVLDNDVVVHHYRIPKGTHVLIATHLNSLRDEYFEESEKFKPERWLSDALAVVGYDRHSPAVAALTHGRNSDLIRELADMQTAMLLIKICKKYKIEYNYGDISNSHEFLAASTKSLKFRFVDRVWNVDS